MERAWYALPVGVAAGLGVLLAAPLPAPQARILAVTAFSIVLWVGNPVPPWFTGLVAVGLVGVAFGPDLALEGFSSAALWLIVFGLIIGEATRRSGLAAVLERRVLARIGAGDRDARAAYRWLLVALSVGGLLFALVLPSALVRVLILAPILVEIGDVFDSRDARLGLFFAPLFSTYYASIGILTANLPNIVIAGIVESIADVSITWTEWFVAMFPIMGLGRTALIVAVVYLLYRPDPDSGLNFGDAVAGGGAGDPDGGGGDSAGADRDPAAAAPADGAARADGGTADAGAGAGTDGGDGGAGTDGTGDGVAGADREDDALRMGLFLLVGVGIWATDFLHGLHPLFGALAVAVLVVLPGVGIMSSDAVGEIDLSIAFFVAAVFTIAAAFRETGFADRAATALLGLIPADAPLPVVLLAVFAVTLALVFVLEGVAVAGVLTPILVPYAVEAGFPLTSVAYVETIALAHYFFPYQSMVLVVMIDQAIVDTNEVIRMATVLSIATFLVLLPPQLLYLLAL